jgi:hypothetical protein
VPAASPAMRGPALAVIGSDGQLERSTSAFTSQLDAQTLLDERASELEPVLNGDVGSAVLNVGDVTAAVEAVVDAKGRRHALLTLSGQAAEGEKAPAANPLLDEDLDSSPAIIFLKDLEGRYLRVNAAHGQIIGVGEALLEGRMDKELPPKQTVDGPRLAERDPSLPEPLQLEYIVPAFDGRPALSVLRFLVNDANGEPVALCGVASPLDQAHVAQAEAERLLDLTRLAHMGPGEAREELLHEWGLLSGEEAAAALAQARTAQERPGLDELELDEEGDERPPAAPRGDEARARARAEQEVSDAGLRAEQARVHAEQARAESDHLRSELELAHAETEQARAIARRERDDAETARAAAQAARSEAAQALLKIEQLEAGSAQLSSRFEQAEAEARESRARAERAEDEATAARARADQAEANARSAQARADEAEGEARQAKLRADQAESEARQAKARADQAESEARQARLQVEELEASVRQARGQVEELELAVTRAKATTEEAEATARQARTRADQAEAELQGLRSAATASGKSTDKGADAELRQRLAAAQSERDSAGAQASELRESLAAERARTDELRLSLTQAQARLDDVAGELEAARTAQAVAEAAAAARIEAEVAAARLEAEAAATARVETAVAAARAEAEAAEGARAELVAAEAARLETEAAAAAERASEAAATRSAKPARGKEPARETGLRWSAAAQRDLALALGDIDDLRSGLSRAAAVLGARGGWDLVAAWLPDPRGLLRCGGSWSSGELAELQEVTSRGAHPVGGSALGKALYAREPHAVSAGAPKADDDPRLSQAFAAGAQTVLHLPIRDGVARIGVLELLSAGDEEPDPDLVPMLEAVGLQLGQFAALIRARRAAHDLSSR